MTAVKTFSLALVLIVFSGWTSAKSETVRQFKHWRSVCDNNGSCKAVAANTPQTGTATTYQLEIARSQGFDTHWTLSFIINGDQARTDEPLHISVDFEQPLRLEPDEDYRSSNHVSTYDIIGIHQGNALMQLFASGNEAFVNYLNTKGQETAARFSLQGISAALLWIDDQQQRLKSPRTIGNINPATAKKPTKTPNDFTSGNTIVRSPDKIPPAIAKMHFADGECVAIDRQPIAGFGFETAAIDKTLTLYLIPCFAGAYNVVYRSYLSSTSNNIPRQLLFASYTDGMGWTGTKDLMNVSYDTKTKTLSAFAKARGLADCGSTALYRWHEYAFKMVEYRYWGKCDGTRLPQDWPIIYPAQKP